MTDYAYKPCTKSVLASAYGTNRNMMHQWISVMVSKKTERDPEYSLGTWQGPVLLKPWQVKEIVEHLGTPEHPEQIRTPVHG